MKPYLIVILALLWLSACQEGPSNKATVETIEGVEYIHNPAAPLHPGRTVSFVEELVIGAEDEAGEIYLYQPGPFTVDANQRVYVGDRSDQTIKVFDQNGVHLRSIGAKGKGPGEFQQIGDLAALPDGRVLVMDFGNRRTSLFRPDGEHLQSCKWPTFLSQVFMITDSSFTAGETTVAAQERQKLVKTFDFSCNELLSYGHFTPVGVWVATNEIRKEETGKATAYDVFDADGYYIAKVWTTVRPTRFVQGKAYSLVVDEQTELPTIRRYRVEWHDESS